MQFAYRNAVCSLIQRVITFYIKLLTALLSVISFAPIHFR